MSRAHPWRQKPPAGVQQLMAFAMESRFYVVRETGPTAFVLKGDISAREFRVQIGGEQTCSCKTSHELCVHILFVMLKVYRIPAQNPIVWQTALLDDEIAKILSGRLQRQQVQAAPPRKVTLTASVATTATRKPVDDVCPICYDDMRNGDALVWCRQGCGSNVHGACMKVWEGHHKERLTCPMCRTDWGPLLIPKAPKRRPGGPAVHPGVRCTACGASPVVGTRFKCSQCPAVNLCPACFADPLVHPGHQFHGLPREDGQWEPAARASGALGLSGRGLATSVRVGERRQTHPPEAHPGEGSLRTLPPLRPPSVQGSPTVGMAEDAALSSSRSAPPPDIHDLQFRDISPEDYERLLQLDAGQRHQTLTPVEVAAIPLVAVSDHLAATGDEVAACAVCQMDFDPADTAKCLPRCGHLFHVDCIATWLIRHRDTCPVDGLPVEVDPVALLETHQTATSSDASLSMDGPPLSPANAAGSTGASQRRSRASAGPTGRRPRRATAPPAPRQAEVRAPAGHVPTAADLTALAVGLPAGSLPPGGPPRPAGPSAALAQHQAAGRPLQGALRPARQPPPQPGRTPAGPPLLTHNEVEPRAVGGAGAAGGRVLKNGVPPRGRPPAPAPQGATAGVGGGPQDLQPSTLALRGPP